MAEPIEWTCRQVLDALCKLGENELDLPLCTGRDNALPFAGFCGLTSYDDMVVLKNVENPLPGGDGAEALPVR